MLSNLLALAAVGALCAGCSAPVAETTFSLDDPANPAAASVPFNRPANVLAMGGTPSTTAPSTSMHMPGNSMPGVPMQGMVMSGPMPGMTMPAQPQ